MVELLAYDADAPDRNTRDLRHAGVHEAVT